MFEFEFFPIFGAGIGLTRLSRAWELNSINLEII